MMKNTNARANRRGRNKVVSLVGPIPAEVNPRAVKGHNKPPRKTGLKFRGKPLVLDPENDSFMHAILQELLNTPATEVSRRSKELAKETKDKDLYLSAGTISNGRRGIKFGGTRWPNSRTARAALATVGKKLVIK